MNDACYIFSDFKGTSLQLGPTTLFHNACSFNDCRVVCAASAPAVKLVTVQTSLLRSKGPQRLALTMPDGTNVVIRRRNDVPGVSPAALHPPMALPPAW